jgi:hypothetical protein
VIIAGLSIKVYHTDTSQVTDSQIGCAGLISKRTPQTKRYLYRTIFRKHFRKLALLKQLGNGFLDGKKMKILAEEQMQLTHAASNRRL